ncbi:MAG: NTP/NDP exchange transporter [Myxococcota bacterium]
MVDDGSDSLPLRLLRRVVDVRAGEVGAMLLAFAWFFCLLAGYYVLRPVRDAMGIEGGVDKLQWLFTATFGAMLVAVPLYSFLVARWPRRRFVPWVYHFFALNLAGFWVLRHLGVAPVAVARVFFVWISVFNLFVVSVFWSLQADLFRSDQGKRLFGFVAAGGTAGALAGPSVTALLAERIGVTTLLLVSLGLLEVAVLCAHRLTRRAPAGPGEHGRGDAGGEAIIGGGVLAGLVRVVRSPYLLGVSGWILGLTLTATFLYFQQARIVEAAFDDAASRTSFFAKVDLLVNVLTLGVQAGLTGRLMTRFGAGPLLALLPVATGLGFVALGIWPTLAILVAFQALRRAANYALARPARELLFTVVPREDKYKAKIFVDTVVYRGGDALSGWIYAGLGALGLSLAGAAFAAAPVAAVWAVGGAALGRAQARRAEHEVPSVDRPGSQR